MTVLEAVEQSKTPIIMHTRSIKAAQQMIDPTEEIIWAQTSNVYKNPIHGELSTDIELFNTDMLPGVIVVTNQRILFVYSMMMNRSSKEIRISDIRSIDAKANFTSEVLRIVGTSGMIIAYNKKQVMLGLRNAINKAIRQKNTTQATILHSTANDDPLGVSDIQQLQALKQLYDSGVITAEEFAAKKAQILNL